MRPHHVAIAAVFLCDILPSAALPQARRALTADDYARAERALGPAINRLVTGFPVRPTWLPDGRAWYGVSTRSGFEFVVVDPRRRTRTAAFDQARLAAALATALGQRVTGGRPPLPWPAEDRHVSSRRARRESHVPRAHAGRLA